MLAKLEKEELEKDAAESKLKGAAAAPSGKALTITRGRKKPKKRRPRKQLLLHRPPLL